MYICTCNNCGRVYEDINPGEKSINYPIDISLPELERGEDEDGEYIGCPVCCTDANLVDNINVAANPELQKLVNLIQSEKQ